MLKTRIRHTILCALLLLAAIPAWAGITYPVSLTAQLLPPYSNCLSDYANGSGMNRLVVNALLRDLNHPAYDVTIKLTVRQGSRVVLETNSSATQPYRLTPGMFTPIDPKQLLDPRNATAGDRYASNGFCLPEGGYELVLQAFDAHNRNVPLSEPQRIFTYLSKSQPPIPTFPQDGACVSESSPTITFSWMDAIATSPSSDKKFLLEVFEMPQGFGEDGNFNSDKNAILLSGAKKIYAETLEGFINSHIVPVTAGTFLKGHTYVWRVRAFCPSRESVTNQNGTIYGTSDYYENGGYSTISTFSFKHCAGMSAFEMLAEEPKVDESVAPKLLGIDLVTGPSAIWENEPDKFPDGYVVEYNTSSETAEWSRIEVGPTESSVVLPGIAQGVKYVVRVKGIKHDSNGETVYTGYSNKLSLQLPEKEEVDCKRNQVPTLTSTEPIESLSIGQTITANGHDVMITTIEQNGDRFSGTGVATISFLGILGKLIGIKMSFENIRVNKNFELMEGTIVSISNPENSIDLNANGALNETYAGTGFEQQTASFGAESNTSTKLSGGLLTWKDSKGNTYNEKVTDNDDIDTQCAPQENSIDDDKGRVVFSVDKDAPLPFDDDKSPFTSNAINKYYTTYGTSFRYNVPWFALTENATGQIIATFEGGDNSVGPNVIEFICRSAKQTVTLPAELIGSNTFRIQIFASEVDKRLDIYAMAKANGAETCTNLTLGRAHLATLRNETKTLHIVPVLGAKVDKEAIQQKLDETYLPFGKKFEVVMEENFGTENDPEFEFLKDGLAIEGSGFMKTETAEMAQLKNLYNTNVGFKQNNTNSAQADHAYIFILPKAETGDVMGDMPRCKPVGYIFLDGNTDIPSTVAHEIGHGVFALEHTFEFGGAKQGETCKQSSRSNLMDYCSPQGNYLTAWQWNLLDTHKDYVIPFLEKDEDGAFQWRDFTWVSDIAVGIAPDAEERSVEDQTDLFIKIHSILRNGLSDKIHQKDAVPTFTFDDNGVIITDLFINNPKSFKLPMNKKTFFVERSYDIPSIGYTNMMLLSYKNNPQISDYKISEKEEMRSAKSRVKAGFYFKDGISFGIISFFAEDHSIDAILEIILHEEKDFDKAQDEFMEWVNYLLFEHNQSNEFHWLASLSPVRGTYRDQIVQQKDFFVSYDKQVKSGGDRGTEIFNKLLNQKFLARAYDELANDITEMHRNTKCKIPYSQYSAPYCSYKTQLKSKTIESKFGFLMYGENRTEKESEIDFSNIDACLYKDGQRSFGLIIYASYSQIETIIYVEIDKNLNEQQAIKRIEEWVEYFTVKENIMPIHIVERDNNGKLLHPHKVDETPNYTKALYQGKNINSKDNVYDNYQFMYIKPSETYSVNLSAEGFKLNELEFKSSSSSITVKRNGSNESNKTISISVTCNSIPTNKEEIPHIKVSKSGEVIYKLFVIPCERQEYRMHVRVLNGKDKNGNITKCQEFNYEAVKKSLNEIYNPVNIYFKFDEKAEIISNYQFGVGKGEEFATENYSDDFYSILIVPSDYILKVPGKNNSRYISGYARTNASYPSMNQYGRHASVLSKYSKDYTTPHEVGHLIFGLLHPFDMIELPEYSSGNDSRNVMDYADPSLEEAIIRAYDILHINKYKGYNAFGRRR